jgi:hypothetical protein
LTLPHYQVTGGVEQRLFEIFYMAAQRFRQARAINFCNRSEVIELDELTMAIQETFQMWFEILGERERESRKSPKTGTGGFFD